MLYEKRARFAGVDKMIGEFFSKLPLDANAWTALSIVFALLTAYALAAQNYPAAALFFALCAACDIIDGNVARFRKIASNAGAYYDTIVDRYVDFIVVVGLFLASVPAAWLLLYLFGSMMTTYAKSAASEKGVANELRGGLLERGERIMILFTGMLLAAFGRIYLTYAIIILAVLSNVSALQRISKAIRKKS